MATGVPVGLFICGLFYLLTLTNGKVLTPPYFNLAQGRNLTATATCGYGVPDKELYCGLTGAASSFTGELIQGQICDFCDPRDPNKDHRVEYAVDGTERWWQSPPLSRLGVELNKVNVTIHLGQEFHVAYVYIRMGNSPRPGVWILERSKDFGKTWLPWQYFAENPSDCSNLFNTRADERLTSDTQIICSTEFSKIVPFNNGEIVVSLVNGRPNAHNFTYADELQEWTRATDIRLALLRTKTLLGHLMAIARQDPTVTRRYYYSIKDINIGGRCVCNGHAESCDVRDPTTSKLVCSCIHNTCGERCERCCAGYPQKKWRSALVDQPFLCEPCECYGHADDCVYDEEVARNRSSIDIHGNYDGGGVCQNCKHNTMGINCEQCVFGYYRPYHVAKNATDACRPCECDPKISTGECEEGSGRCLCRPEYAGLACDRCNFGYYGYPDCIPCECDINGTENSICTSGTGHCPCKYNYDGVKCNQCAQGYYNFPECKPCECNTVGSQLTVCDLESGQCRCDERYGGRDCGECANGFYNFPQCLNCGCDSRGTKADICDKESGVCLCNDRYAGSQCNRCAPGFYNFPICQECQCASPGSKTTICAENGQCLCHNNFGGLTCNHCAPGFYKYPECSLCNCDVYGSIGASCDQVTGQCRCRDNFVGVTCNKCGPNLYNYPNCEECNCHPDGAKAVPGYPAGGCGSVTVGRLCECKDLVIGRNCDTCKTGYWNLNRNNPGGCEECNCHSPGTLAGVNRCDMLTGQCECKPRVGGRDCNRCLDGYYNLQENNPFGCVDCNCDRGGSVHMACDKTTGQCQCKQRVTGQKCDKAITGNFVPTLHQYKFEVEDGVTPEGARIKYGYDENIFPNFSWRGYGILTKVQPEVKLDVNIRSPSLYQIIYRFTNREDKLIKGKVTLTSDSPTEITQTGELSFVQSKDPRFTTVSSGNTQSSFVLNPGIWTVSTTVPDQVQLDYFVLIPQGYYEASQVQQAVKNPCNVTGDPGPCVHFSYPDLFGNPTGLGKNGYVELDGMRGDAQQNPNELLSNNLGSPGLVHITEQQRGFWIDLDVPTPDEYLIIVSYHNPKNVSKDLDVQVRTTAGSRDGKITLASCPFGSLCRQVIKDQNGFEAIFNITTGVASIYISAPDAGQDTDVSIDSVYGVKRSIWNHDYIMPRIICIKVNGVCITSTYGHPVGSVRIEFEQSPNEALISTVPPPDIHDKNAGLVNLDDTIKFVDQTLCPIHENDKADQCKTEKLRTVIPITLFGKVTKPGQYVFVVHYYMPSLAGLNIPITMYVDGKEFTGTFSPIYCPNIVGCRETIKFDATGGNALRMTATDVKVVFNSTTGGKIWLDYLLIVPQDQYKYDVLDVQPIDKSGEFINLCVDEGFQLRSDEQFCKDGAFTLTTNFNNGALDCNCNPDGSRSFTCDSFGGNCQCRENIIGRTCSACRPGFYGFPNCKACNCPYGLCHEVTGECICPQLVEGSKCDVCKPQAYGYDALIGCQLCRCNSAGVLDGNLNCDQISGQCNCKPNIGGRKCDICLPGYHTFPYCQDCGCDRKGTKSGICDTSTGQCICKENVEGSLCESCSDGYFSLTAENPKGCIRCFCFGHTTRCDSAGLSWDQVNEMTGWQVTNAENSQVNTVFNTAQLVFEADEPEEKNNVYWVAPAAFLGRQINAYGGMLRYTVQFALKPNVQPMSISQADVLISGNNMTIAHYSESHPSPGVSLSLQVPLVQYNFVHYGTNSPISREQFMMILTSIESLQIRASHYTSMTETSLSDVSLEVASESGTGSLANSVEKCQCPPNYRGLSCEECSPGYYRVRTPPFLGICLKCNCNGHSDTCDVETGECFNCQDHTTGPHCEQCLAGYYGDPTIEGCQICSCPLPILSNNFATSCVVNDYDATTVCSCLPGYDGQTCERCASGYYGDPYQPGSNCQPCRCSGNIDVKNPDSCDRLTGQCLLCQNNTAGETCNYCRDWYFGDAVYRKDCQACACDTCGTDKCDRDSGACLCKDNVEGARCEKCAENTWGYDYCTGCKPCECGVGSVTGQCNLQTGVCSCLPGVEGEKCDKCKPYHWNYGINGCQACDCLSNGTVGCDAETGKCQCLPGVTGDQCDRCQPRWVLVPNRGCQECDYCVHLLMDDLDVMAKNMTIISRELGEVSVGAGAYSQLSHYNKIVADYRPQVDNMSYLTPESIKEQVNDLNISAAIALINVKTFQGTADVNMYEAKDIPGSIQNLTKSSADSEESSKEFQKYAKETVEFIQNVGTTMMETSTNRNNQKVLEDSERIATEISGLDFDAQNKSSYLEAEAAMNASEDVKKLKVEAMMNDNKTSEYLTTINDISSRLRDLLNNSQHSSHEAENAKNTIKRLKAVHLNKLKQQETAFDQLTQERVVSIKEADELLTEANMKLDGAEKSVEGINNETANLNGNLPNLNGSVEALGDSLMPSSEKVNKSLVHLQMLKQQAETFQIVEYDSKNTENALEAVKAYKTIINNIEEAQMKANATVEDSPLLTINEFDVTPTLEKSEMLANESEEQIAQNRDLNETLKSAINSVNMAEKKNADVDKLLKVVMGELEDIQKISSGNESAATMQKVSDVAAKVDAIEKLSEQVNEDKLSNQLKKDFILQNRPKILGDMAQIEQNINLANESIPEVQSLLNNLTQRSASLSKESSDLTLSVELLRRRIEEARDEAKRIKVGLSFLGNTTVTLRSPPELENTASKTKISFTIKTNSTDALLVYIGPNTLSQPAQPRQQRSVQGKMDPDFMALELKEGRILFTYNLGSGSARIHSDIQVNNAEVYKVIAERIGKSGNLTVFSNKTKEVVVTKGSSQGPYVVLELDPAKTHFMLGGVSSMVQIPQELTTRFFFGEIQHLMFEEKHLGLWNFAAGENNYHGVKQEIVILPDYKLQGVAFDGQGYAVFENKHNTANRTRATFTIKTFAEDGLILYMGGVRDFLSLEMRKGKFFFQFDLGGGVYTLETQNTYNNGRWHVIYIDRSLKTAVVNINNKEEDLKISAEGNLQTLETGRLAFIGGLDFFNMTHPVTKTGFKGCMKDITLGNIPENPLKSGRSKGVQEGCILDKNSASFISSRSSYVAFDEVSVGETFELTFKMKTTEPEALLVYVSDKTQTNTLAVSVFNGMIVVTQELGAVPLRLNSKSSSYNDGSWHYIQIIKEGKRLTLTVDDREIIQDSSDSVELITNTKVYFGGVASDYTITSTVVPTKLSLTGCIGDITINKMYYGFENAEYNGITLDCPTEKIDETKIESDVPVVCKLPQVGSTEDEKGEFIGKCFGTESRQEFGKYKSHPSLSTIEVTFKTEAENGLILYSADQKHVDFLAIYIANGSVYFGFNCGSGTAKVKSPKQYNDAQWHKVVAERNRNIGTLFIDGNQVASGRSGGKALSLNTIEPNYIGGLPQEIRNKTFKNIGDYHGFDGCMTNISLYKGFAEKPKVEFNVTESYSSEELGTYFGSSGGRVTLIDKFKVGRDLNISMEIKPRSANGVLLAVHSNSSDYLILQLVAGELIFTVDNGAGAISTSYRPQTSDYLCDGEWHKIQAYKDRHIIRLSVDGVRPTQVQSSRPDSSSVDTFDPLYIGGVPDGKAKGIITTTHYIGCIRLLALNERVQSIKRGSAVGDVRLGACPKR